MILNMFSFLSKDIVIHTISSILGTRNFLHFNAKGVENYFGNCLRYCFSFLFFLFFFQKHVVPVSLKCMYDLTDGFISTARFKKEEEEQQLTEFQRI